MLYACLADRGALGWFGSTIGWNGDNVAYIGRDRMMQMHPCVPPSSEVDTDTVFAFSSNIGLCREVSLDSPLTLVSSFYFKYRSR